MWTPVTPKSILPWRIGLERFKKYRSHYESIAIWDPEGRKEISRWRKPPV